MTSKTLCVLTDSDGFRRSDERPSRREPRSPTTPRVEGSGRTVLACPTPAASPGWARTRGMPTPVAEGDRGRAGAAPAVPGPAAAVCVDHGWRPGLYLAEDLVLSEPPPQARRGVFGFPVPSPLLQEIAAGSPRWALPGDATARSDRPIRSAAHYGPSAWWMDQPDLYARVCSGICSFYLTND